MALVERVSDDVIAIHKFTVIASPAKQSLIIVLKIQANSRQSPWIISRTQPTDPDNP
jgi:hypothetical protein